MMPVVPIRASRASQGRWRSDLLPTICILAVLAAVACMPFAIAFATWADHMSLRKEWRITGPAGAVEVTTGVRTVVYEPGVGHPTTVTVRGGQPSCVVGGWFR